MHRSGTSYLARALNLRGVYLGEPQEMISDLWRPASDNIKGHWENQKILNLSEKTLEYSGGSWDNIPDKIKVDKKIVKELKSVIVYLVKNSILASGIKDPRMLLCLEKWSKYFPKQFVLVGIFRHPLKVCQSLKKRNQFSYEKSLKLWQAYNQKLLYHLEKDGGFLLNFDWPKEKINSELDTICRKLGLPTDVDISDWLDENRESDNTFDENHPLDDGIKEIYDKLKERSEKNKQVKLKIKPINKKQNKLATKLLNQINMQGNYFKSVNDSNLKKISQTNDEISRITKQLKYKETEISQSKDYISKLQKDLQEKQNGIVQTTDEISRIMRHLKDKEAEISQSKDYISKLQKDLQEKQAEISQNNDYISRLQNDLQNKQNEISKTTDEITKLTKDIKDKEIETIQSKDYISKLQKDLQDKQNEVQQAGESTTRLTEELGNKDKELEKAKEYVSKLNSEISQKNEEIKRLEDKLKEYAEDLKMLKENQPKYYTSRL